MFDVLAGTLEDLSTSVVGLLQPHMSVQTVQEQLIIVGIPTIKVASLGGNQALISSPINGFLKESLLVRRDWWLSWFKGFTRWLEELPPPGRFVWLRCLGLPVHLCNATVVHQIGAVFSEVMEVDEKVFL